MMVFFHNIINHRAGFDDSLIPSDFLSIAKTHKKVIYKRLVVIYTELNKLTPQVQREFCERVATSNNIQQICNRTITPLKRMDIPITIRQILTDLFLDLYTQILRGNNTFSKKYGTIRLHFEKFRELNSAITICPLCGISELKTEFDDSPEQYDHFFPKTLYPVSSVNFENLVPTCKDCNGFDCKSDKDTFELGTEKIFYPYSKEEQEVDIDFLIAKEPEMKDWIWTVNISGRGINLTEEITSWDKIYNIKSRYIGHIKGRIGKWINFYNEYKRKALVKGHTEAQINESFLLYVETEEEFGLNYLRKPAFDAYFNSLTL